MRQMVADYLTRGRTLVRYRGLSPCRFCGRHNGSKELTDGTYCWPEGLAHYLSAHAVRLPDDFVAHVEARISSTDGTPRPEFDHLGQRLPDDRYDKEYEDSMATLFHRSRAAPAPGPRRNWLDADVDTEWWQHQGGFGPSQREGR